MLVLALTGNAATSSATSDSARQSGHHAGDLDLPLDQYGMEYNPVAINEVLAYLVPDESLDGAADTRNNRFFVELVNTLTSPATPPRPGPNPSTLT